MKRENQCHPLSENLFALIRLADLIDCWQLGAARPVPR
jgi:hypothetical protein